MKKDKLSFEIIDYDILNTHLDHTIVRAKIVNVGKNHNGSHFSKESIIKAIPTLYNIPLIGIYSAGENDFKSHAKNDWERQQTYAVGTIPESCHAHFEEHNGMEYLVADIVVWKEYFPNFFDVIARNEGKEQQTTISMEITLNDYIKTEDAFDITDFAFNGICLLGEKVNPGIPDAGLRVVRFEEGKIELQDNDLYSKLTNLANAEVELLHKFSEKALSNDNGNIEKNLKKGEVGDMAVEKETLSENLKQVVAEQKEKPTQTEALKKEANDKVEKEEDTEKKEKQVEKNESSEKATDNADTDKKEQGTDTEKKEQAAKDDKGADGEDEKAEGKDAEKAKEKETAAEKPEDKECGTKMADKEKCEDKEQDKLEDKECGTKMADKEKCADKDQEKCEDKEQDKAKDDKEEKPLTKSERKTYEANEKAYIAKIANLKAELAAYMPYKAMYEEAEKEIKELLEYKEEAELDKLALQKSEYFKKFSASDFDEEDRDEIVKKINDYDFSYQDFKAFMADKVQKYGVKSRFQNITDVINVYADSRDVQTKYAEAEEESNEDKILNRYNNI